MKQPGKQAALWAALGAVGTLGAVHLGAALTLDRRIEYREETIRSPKFGPDLDGYTAAFVTDVHRTPPRELEAVARRVRERGASLLLLGGDFSAEQHELSRSLDILAGLDLRDGAYGVPGNHDDAGELRAQMARRGMRLLENEGERVRGALYLAGTEDLWSGHADPRAASAGARAGDFVLLLAHNPDTATRRDLRSADLVLCGHTHGGEVSLLGLWSPAMYFVSGNGQRYRTGWCRSPQGVDVLVSNGVGRHSPLRVFARPQVIFLTLCRDADSTPRKRERPGR